MHQSAVDFIAGTIHSFGVQHAPHVIDLGGRDINGTIHSIFTHKPYVVDLVDGPDVDHVADAADYQPDREWDVVLCTEVLEHTKRWTEIIDTAFTCLTEGGLLILTCATHGRPPHGAESTIPQKDEWYRNIDPTEFADHLRTHNPKLARVRVASGVFTADDLYCWALR